MPRYNRPDEDDEEATAHPSGRHEFRETTRNPHDKDVQAEVMRPIVQYLKKRLKKTLHMTYNDVSRHTGHAYGRAQFLLSQGLPSPSFYDLALFADAAGTSLDYLGEMAGLFHPERVVDPSRYLFLSDEEINLIEQLRKVAASPTRDAAIAGFVENLEKLPSTPTKRQSKTQPPVPSATR